MRNNFRKSNSGIAAIEFAIMLPFLIAVLFGAYEVTTYITTVRKIDNVTNDIAYIVSREGNIAPNDGSVAGCPIGPYCGGDQRLKDIFKNAIPFLIYPYQYDPENDGHSQIEVRFVGQPSPNGCPGTGGPNSDGINRDTLRVMWIEKYPLADGPTTVDPITDAVSMCTDSTDPNSPGNCPKACDNPNYTQYNSFYSDASGGRANMIYPGQSYILVDFAYDFKGTMGVDFPGLGGMLPNHFEKFASYASRSKLNGTNGQLENFLQYCTDCNVANSKYGGTNGMSPASNTTGVPAIRTACVLDDPLNPLALQNNNNSYSSGCSF